MEKQIRDYILDLGVDDVGFASVQDYQPKSYEITKFLSDAKSIIVLAYRILSSCESPSTSAAQNGYLKRKKRGDRDVVLRNSIPVPTFYTFSCTKYTVPGRNIQFCGEM